MDGGRTLFAVGLLLAVTCLAYAQESLPYSLKAKPSTPDERAKVVQVVRDLEKNPSGSSANQARKWMSAWMTESSDYRVPACQSLFKKGEPKPDGSRELTFQLRASTVAFMIENPDLAQDPEARIVAGIAGVLKAYESMRQGDRQQRSQFLDLLLQSQETKPTDNAVREIMTRCSDVPLSNSNSRSSSSGDTVYAPIEVEIPPVIKQRPLPSYTREARVNQTKGIVLLQAVLASSGAVTDIEVIKRLPDGLTESSIAAARAIQFEPAVKHGQRVSTLIKLEYNFDVF